LALNLGTGSITIQFHVVLDDLHTTVPSIERETALPDHWEERCLENSTHIMLDTMPSASNSFVPTTSAEGANAPTEGALPSPAEPELRRSTRGTSGKFQTARYADSFLARVKDYGASQTTLKWHT
jgi:hypothetical protein